MKRFLPGSSILATVFLCTSAVAQLGFDPILGTVVDPQGKPVVGVTVEAWRTEGRGMLLRDRPSERTLQRIAVAPTIPGGRFALQLPVGLPCQLRVDHPPHARYVLNDTIPGADVRIELVVGAVFEGQLVRKGSGEPVAGDLRGWHPEDNTEVFQGRTDELGRFRFDRLPPGEVRVDVHPDNAAPRVLFHVVLVAGASAGGKILVAPGAVLRGRVLDAQTQAPIPNAVIGAGGPRNRGVRAGADGRYEMQGYDGLQIHCVAAGYVRQFVERPNPSPNPLVVDFRLERGLAVAGQAVDPSGRPMSGVYVAAIGMRRDRHLVTEDWITMRTDAEGRFRASGLRPSLNHVLLLRRDRFATMVYALPEADRDGVRQAGTIQMRHPHPVRGRVIDRGEYPVPFAKTTLIGMNADRHRLAPGGKLATGEAADVAGWPMLRILGRRNVRTDSRGGFTFGDVPPGEYHVLVYGKRGQVIGDLPEFTISAGSKPVELIIEAEPEGR